MSIEAMKQWLEVLLDSMDDVRDCLNEALQHEGYAKYDRRIEAYREQIAKHEKAITTLRTAIEAAEKQSAERGEPVAYAVYHRMGGSKTLHWPEQHSENGDAKEYKLVPLYITPPAAQPAPVKVWKQKAMTR